MKKLMSNKLKSVVNLSMLAGSLTALIATTHVSAHNLNMWPSQFNIHSKNPTTVTVDLSFSELAFRLDHAAPIAGLSALDPEGSPLNRLGNAYQNSQRTTVDLPIDSQGTYTLRYQSSPRYTTSYTVGKTPKKKRLRLNKIAAQSELSHSAKNVVTTKSVTHGIAFITNTKPSKKPYQASGNGLELTPITHPSDYVTNEAITMQVSYNGKPLTNVEVSLYRDGSQYLANSTAKKSATDNQGQLNFMFQQGGRYMLGIKHSVKENTTLYDEVGYRLFYAFEVVYE